ncbi:hypothetical protein [Bdellovibrio sp. HCB-162]|uniref:hypothetical protein n=1 Tax=Bdellovibrio sp. HCB-162 TaxID=3394234 RepID=UPI0039BC462C
MRFFIVIAMLLPGFSFAKSNVGPEFTCMTELPSTTFYVKSNGSQSEPLTELKVVHHFGANTMPIHQGVVLASDFAYLQQKANLMKKLGDTFTVRFKSDKCENFGPGLYSCGSSDAIEINGLDIKGYSLVTRVIETKVYEYTFKSYQVTFSFNFEGMSYDMPMVYSPEECNFK